MKDKTPFKTTLQWCSWITGLMSLGLAVYFVLEERCDQNFTYYLISVSAIYGTIVLAYLQQKLSLLRQQKEMHVEKSKPLWNALLHYRLLCSSMVSQLNQTEYKMCQDLLSLKLTHQQLGAFDFLPEEMVDPALQKKFRNKFPEMDKRNLALAAGFADYFAHQPSDIFSDASYLNRVYASNNSSVNAYIGLLINNGAFHLLSESQYDEQKLKALSEVVSKERSFGKLVNHFGIEQMDTMRQLKAIEINLLNKVLFDLYDSTFIIEKKLPFHFVFVMANAFLILVFGTIIPLFNAFTFQSRALIRFCGGMSVGLLVMAIVLLFLVFRYENIKELFRHSSVVYQGENDR